ncbi:MAG: hypothetical protein JSU86_02365, partial [Phycisphaerales bacterium]
IQRPGTILWNAEHGGLIRSDVGSGPRKHCAAPITVKIDVEPDAPVAVGPTPRYPAGMEAP